MPLGASLTLAVVYSRLDQKPPSAPALEVGGAWPHLAPPAPYMGDQSANSVVPHPCWLPPPPVLRVAIQAWQDLDLQEPV